MHYLCRNIWGVQDERKIRMKERKKREETKMVCKAATYVQSNRVVISQWAVILKSEEKKRKKKKKMHELYEDKPKKIERKKTCR